MDDIYKRNVDRIYRISYMYLNNRADTGLPKIGAGGGSRGLSGPSDMAIKNID